jgi:hypothetical protein
MVTRLKRIGFEVDATYGNYRLSPWHEEAEVWLIAARRPGPR